MRALIGQLRPQGLEEGLAAALEKYAEVLGLQVIFTLSGVLRLPPPAEETFSVSAGWFIFSPAALAVKLSEKSI